MRERIEAHRAEAKSTNLCAAIDLLTRAAQGMESTDPSSPSQGTEDDLKPFGDRPDVIYKTILRCFKKFMGKDFNSRTSYKKLKRRVAMKGVAVSEVIQSYVRAKFPDAEVPDLDLYVSALIQVKPDPQVVPISKAINTALYKFNKNRLAELLERRPFAFLLLSFLEDQEAVKAVFQKSKSAAAFENLVEVMKARCRLALE